MTKMIKTKNDTYINPQLVTHFYQDDDPSQTMVFFLHGKHRIINMDVHELAKLFNEEENAK